MRKSRALRRQRVIDFGGTLAGVSCSVQVRCERRGAWALRFDGCGGCEKEV